ncbi:MAG: DUF4249 family protein [Bacteroidia bacterium]|nr:DUF4249 family protein [Bacteroidia bacterium]
MKTRPKSLITIFIVIALCTCIDPYKPKLSGYGSLLVVEGLITDEKASYEVKLSRTMQAEDLIPEKVNDADMTITDEIGNQTILQNFGDGLYKTNSVVFTSRICSDCELSGTLIKPDFWIDLNQAELFL